MTIATTIAILITEIREAHRLREEGVMIVVVAWIVIVIIEAEEEVVDLVRAAEVAVESPRVGAMVEGEEKIISEEVEEAKITFAIMEEKEVLITEGDEEVDEVIVVGVMTTWQADEEDGRKKNLYPLIVV